MNPETDKPPRIQHILKRTIYEEYEYDPAKLRADFTDEFAAFRADLQERRTHRIPFKALTEDEIWEWFVTQKFEYHEGSAYGEELFGQIDADSGIELLTRSEDD